MALGGWRLGKSILGRLMELVLGQLAQVLRRALVERLVVELAILRPSGREAIEVLRRLLVVR